MARCLLRKRVLRKMSRTVWRRASDRGGKATLVELAAQCAFTPTDMTTVLNSILGSVGSAGLVRRTAQNFEPFVHYLPEKVWNLLLDPDSVQDYRVDVLHAWLRTMGLRNPTEGTIKLINSFCLSLAERWDALVTMNTSTEKGLLHEHADDVGPRGSISPATRRVY